MDAPEGDFMRLAEKARLRREHLGMRQEDVRSAGGPSTVTIRQIENGRPIRYQGVIKRKLERVLGWTTGDFDVVLGGGDETLIDAGPTSVDTRRDETADPSFEEAFAEYRRALRRLRLAAEADPGVDPEATALIEDLTLIAHAMMYGGARGGRQAIRDVAEGDKREALSENDSHQTA